uniref:uncharacterized protein LOC122594685 n=1 Tax=Erigeron canadensis TaxID=72917 RepID=UPI001CB89EAD|nr:uncharacterized protein LOC122594685 [Erigeron canadensis]
MDHGASNFQKVYEFDGFNYTGWVDKMKFLLISLKVFYVLDPNLSPIPEDPLGEKADVKVITDLEKQRILRKEDEALCYKYIKKSLSERLCDLYALRSNNDPRLLWKTLEINFKDKEHMRNKHLIGRFLTFRMADGKPMREQAQELNIIVQKLKDNSIVIPKAFLRVALITKLPPSWKIFTERMMSNKYDHLSLRDLMKQIYAEERARIGKAKQSMSARPRLVKNTKTTPGDHGPSKTKLRVKNKPTNNFKKIARHCNVRSAEAMNAIDAEIDDLVALVNIRM